MNTLQKVLIIDSDAKARLEIESAMTCDNYAILNASSYDEALSLITSETVSRIIIGSNSSGQDSHPFIRRVSEETKGRKAMICHLTDSEDSLGSFPVVPSEVTQFAISRTADIHQLREKFQAVDLGTVENAQNVYQVGSLLDEVFGTLKEYTTEMCDSIRYASKIQKAILPGEHSLTKIIDSFVLNAPKNIVSGDFFWFTVRFNRVIIAVADCTGHGVPGALLSIIGHDTLNSIVNEKNISEPAHILKNLNQKFQRTFENNESGNPSIKDGMDIAVISIDPSTRTIDFAGARRPLTGFINGEFVKIKGDLMSIGVHSPVSTEFTQHRINFGPDDIFYLGSDGYADQFGGPFHKKMGTRQYEQLLAELHQLPVKTQKERLESFFNTWKKHNSQTDDVLVLGIKPGTII